MDTEEINELFIKSNEAKYEAFKDKILKEELVHDLIILDKTFSSSVKVILNSINEVEGLYRDQYSNCWRTHSELILKMHCRGLKFSRCSIPIYFYLIANYLDLDFYLKHHGDGMFSAESIRFEPFYLGLVDNVKVNEDLTLKIKIKTKN